MYIYIDVYIYVYIYIYIFTYVYVYTYVSVYICIHTVDTHVGAVSTSTMQLASIPRETATHSREWVSVYVCVLNYLCVSVWLQICS